MWWTGCVAAGVFAGVVAGIGLLLVVLGFAGWRAGFVPFLAVVLGLSAWAKPLGPPGIQGSGRVRAAGP